MTCDHCDGQGYTLCPRCRGNRQYVPGYRSYGKPSTCGCHNGRIVCQACHGAGETEADAPRYCRHGSLCLRCVGDCVLEDDIAWTAKHRRPPGTWPSPEGSVVLFSKYQMAVLDGRYDSVTEATSTWKATKGRES